MPTSIVWLGPLHQPCIESVLLRAKEDLLPVDGCYLRRDRSVTMSLHFPGRRMDGRPLEGLHDD